MSQLNSNWWKASADELYSDVFSYVKAVEKNQSYKSEQNLRHFRLYGNSDNLPLGNYNFTRTEPTYAASNRVTMNVVQSMIDTVVSKITKNKPRPMFLTDGGDWSLQRKAQKLTKFVEGQFYSTDFYAKASVAFLHSCIFGTGALKIFRNAERIEVEHVFIDEIIVDDNEAMYGAPRQMHQRKWVHRDVLKQMFPGKKNALAIDTVGKTEQDYMHPTASEQSSINEMIQVLESWHLPSGPDAEDGKHCISIENCTLLEEEYKKNYFPFVFFRWGLRPLGFFGQGISEQLTGIQVEINKILRTIQVSMHLVSIPKIFVEASSKIVTAHLNNKIGGIIKYAGVKPEPGQLGVIPAELFSHLDRLYQRCYEVIGVSQLAATSAKPAGLNSGKALRMYNDIETERFLSVGMRYEQAFLDAGKQLIDLAREIDADSDKGLSVKVKSDKFMKSIKWKEVDIDEDKYLMQMFPTSALSQNPASRLQEVQELMQAGLIGKESGMKLLNFPDLEAFYDLENAGLSDIERQMEMMIDDGKYNSPEPFQNLELGIVKMQQAYLMFKAQGAPDDRLDLFRRWMNEADRMLNSAKNNAMAMQQASAAAMQTALPAGQAMPTEPSATPLPAEAQTPIA